MCSKGQQLALVSVLLLQACYERLIQRNDRLCSQTKHTRECRASRVKNYKALGQSEGVKVHKHLHLLVSLPRGETESVCSAEVRCLCF